MQRPVGWPAGRGFCCLSVRPWRLPPSTQWGARSACPLAWKAATQMAATKAAAQTGAPEAATQAVAPEAAMWAVASVTGTRAAARGAVTRMEAARWSRTLSVRELVTPQALAVTPPLMLYTGSN